MKFKLVEDFDRGLETQSSTETYCTYVDKLSQRTEESYR